LELDVVSMLSSKVEATSLKLGHLNANSVSTSTPSTPFDIWGLVDHFTVHCQVGSSFGQDISDQANHVDNNHPRATSDLSLLHIFLIGEIIQFIL